MKYKNILLSVLALSFVILTGFSIIDKKDIFSLPDEDLNVMLENAANYGSKNYFLANYNFILYSIYNKRYLFPMPVEIHYDMSDNEYDISFVGGHIPIEDRKIDTASIEKTAEADDFIAVVEQLSAKRELINFDKLYQKFGWIVRKVISKATYDKNYAPTVEILLITYADLEENEDLYYDIAHVMDMHWEESLINTHVGLPDFYDYLKPKLSDEALEQLERFFLSSKTDYQNHYMVIWSYSFWLRRRMEGKAEEIYNTLCLINNDYGNMEY